MQTSKSHTSVGAGHTRKVLSQNSTSRPRLEPTNSEASHLQPNRPALSPSKPAAAPNSLTKPSEASQSTDKGNNLPRRDTRQQASQRTLHSSAQGDRLSSSLMRKYKSIEKIKVAIMSHRDDIGDGDQKVSVAQYLHKQFHVPQRNQKMVQQRELAMFESNSSTVSSFLTEALGQTGLCQQKERADGQAL